MFEYRSVLDRPAFDPFGWEDVVRGFDRLAREFDRGVPAEGRTPSSTSVVEEADKFVLRVDVPGLADKDVHVDLHDGILTITADRPVDAPAGYSARRRERAPFQLSRSYAVGDAIDPEKTTAEIRDGVLTVSVGKAPAAQKKTITVKTA
jgi:HSP20 family molecular chaperone IbpA